MKDKTLPLINLAWHIPEEIRTYLSSSGYTGSVIDILGANDFLSKPFDMSLLLLKTDSILKNRANNGELDEEQLAKFKELSIKSL